LLDVGLDLFLPHLQRGANRLLIQSWN